LGDLIETRYSEPSKPAKTLAPALPLARDPGRALSSVATSGIETFFALRFTLHISYIIIYIYQIIFDYY
jgi:hypothetical protein